MVINTNVPKWIFALTKSVALHRTQEIHPGFLDFARELITISLVVYLRPTLNLLDRRILIQQNFAYISILRVEFVNNTEVKKKILDFAFNKCGEQRSGIIPFGIAG